MSVGTADDPAGRGRLDPRVARTRATVIAATLDLLAEHGYAGASIDAIARRSGVARTTIYRHWSSLADLVQDAATSTVGLAPVEDTGDPRTDLAAHLHMLVDKLTRSDWGRLLPTVVDAASRDPDVAELQRRSTAERRAAAMAIVHRGVERGQLRHDVDVDLIGEMVAGVLFTRHLVTHLPVTDELVERLLDLAFPLIRSDGTDSDG